MEYIRGALSWVDLSIEQLVMTLLIVAVYLLYKELKLVRHKYAQLDKLVFAHSLIINTKLGVKTIKIHRSGDYEIAQPINEASP
jgi:hypothetical protein